MSEKPHEDGSSGRLIRAATKSLGSAAVDCSTWDAEIPAAQWSSGKLQSVTRSKAAVEGTCIPAGLPDLEITLQIGPELGPGRAFAAAVRLVAEVFAFDPGLGLIYDPARSRAEEGRVVMLLTPSRPGPGVEARLEKLAEVVRRAAAQLGGVALNGVQVLRAA